jgi:hypothetical protein
MTIQTIQIQMTIRSWMDSMMTTSASDFAVMRRQTLVFRLREYIKNNILWIMMQQRWTQLAFEYFYRIRPDIQKIPAWIRNLLFRFFFVQKIMIIHKNLVGESFTLPIPINHLNWCDVIPNTWLYICCEKKKIFFMFFLLFWIT